MKMMTANKLDDDWGNYKESKLTHVVGINALSIIGADNLLI